MGDGNSLGRYVATNYFCIWKTATLFEHGAQNTSTLFIKCVTFGLVNIFKHCVHYHNKQKIFANSGMTVGKFRPQLLIKL